MAWNARLYSNETDLSVMISLVLRRPPDRVAEFPCVADLQELLSLAEIREHTRLWHDVRDGLVGFAIFNPTYNSLAFQIEPSLTDDELIEQMLDWGLAEWRQSGASESLQVSCRDDDLARIAWLEQRGFVRDLECAWHYVRALQGDIPLPQLPDGFVIRPVLGESEAEQLVELHRAAFGTENLTVEERLSWMRTSEYKPELDLVAVSPDGNLVGYVLCQISEQENVQRGRKVGYTDPVAVHPAFQRRGLARSLLLTGLRLLQGRGMDWAELGTGSENTAMQKAAESVGFVLRNKTLFFMHPLENDR